MVLYKVDKFDVEGYEPYYQHTKVKDLINKKLPLEIFQKVLSYLDNEDKQVICLVNHYWKQATIDIAKREHLSIIKTFANFIKYNVINESQSCQKKQLLRVCNDIEFLKENNLLHIKAGIHKLREKIANQLIILTNENLSCLKDLYTEETNPTFFKNIFSLAEIFKDLVHVNQENYQSLEESDLTKIFMKALEEGFADKAIEAAKKIDSWEKRDNVLYQLSVKLLSKGHWNKALEAKSGMYDRHNRFSAAHKIALELARQGFVHKAKKIGYEQLYRGDFTHCDWTLCEIAKILANKGIGGEAIKAADELFHTKLRIRTLRCISIKLANKLLIDEALLAARLIKDKRKITRTLATISKNLIEKFNFVNKAVEIAQLIPDQNQKWLTIQEIAVIVAKRGNSMKAVKIVQLIPDQEQKWLTIQEIAAIPAGIPSNNPFRNAKSRMFHYT